LLEISISIVILTVAAFLLSSTVGASLSHSVAKRERAIAVEAAMNMMETLRATPFIDVYTTYNSLADDDLLGPGTAPGALFEVAGLDPIVEPGGAPRPVGRISLPEMEQMLREDSREASLGMPRDLSGDMQIDSLEHADDYLVLPVIVRIEWQGSTGPRHFEMSTLLADAQRVSQQ